MAPWQLLYHWPLKTHGTPPPPHRGDGETKAMEGRGQQRARRQGKGRVCCRESEEGHASQGKVKNPEK